MCFYLYVPRIQILLISGSKAEVGGCQFLLSLVSCARACLISSAISLHTYNLYDLRAVEEFGGFIVSDFIGLITFRPYPNTSEVSDSINTAY